MTYLIDTDVLSEPTKVHPNEDVMRWLEKELDKSFISAVCIEEMRYGALRLPFGKRRQALLLAIDRISTAFKHRMLSLGASEATRCAELRAVAWGGGNNVGYADIMIAATALEHGMIVATRNVKDYEALGVAVYNPFGD